MSPLLGLRVQQDRALQEKPSARQLSSDPAEEQAQLLVPGVLAQGV